MDNFCDSVTVNYYYGTETMLTSVFTSM